MLEFNQGICKLYLQQKNVNNNNDIRGVTSTEAMRQQQQQSRKLTNL